VLCQDHPYRLAANLVDYAAFDGLLGEQPNSPSSAALRRRTAHQSDQRCFLRAVQFRFASRARLLTQRVLETLVQVPMGHARNLAPIRAQRRRGRVKRHAAIEHQQRLHPTKHARGPPLACAVPTPQLAPVSRRQLQPRIPLLGLHPPL
jgi:hypothetical protein